MHEKFLPIIKEACENYKDDTQVEGLLFKYLHFYGTDDYIGDSRKWYNREIRIIRNDKSIRAYKDAQGFRKGKIKLKVAPIEAYVYHYGWVKSPKQMKTKMKDASRYWIEDQAEWENFIKSEDVFDFNEFDSLRKFSGSHPNVMKKRIGNMNWNIKLDVNKKNMSMTKKLLMAFEKLTGIRLFSFRNYRIIR